jgi:hypothetical protein
LPLRYARSVSASRRPVAGGRIRAFRHSIRRRVVAPRGQAAGGPLGYPSGPPSACSSSTFEGRSADLCTRGLSPGRIRIENLCLSACRSSRLPTLPDGRAIAADGASMNVAAPKCKADTTHEGQLYPLFVLSTGCQPSFRSEVAPWARWRGAKWRQSRIADGLAVSDLDGYCPVAEIGGCHHA